MSFYRKINISFVLVGGDELLVPQEVVSVRAQLNVSCAVFARYLRSSPRTLENWEQGRAKPNAQAALLIRMVAQFPDKVHRLELV